MKLVLSDLPSAVAALDGWGRMGLPDTIRDRVEDFVLFEHAKERAPVVVARPSLEQPFATGRDLGAAERYAKEWLKNIALKDEQAEVMAQYARRAVDMLAVLSNSSTSEAWDSLGIDK